jgi:hypothetical protein
LIGLGILTGWGLIGLGILKSDLDDASLSTLGVFEATRGRRIRRIKR